MAESKSWEEMTHAEQETELVRISRQEKYELYRAKVTALESARSANNVHVMVGAAQTYALLNGSLTSTTSPSRS